ncbi:MAG TPA: DUF882 domain-containing protein [Polyangiaceae bacterium]|nr:DUF882 domain-containing protein [Polyangiaceae bacterium]
MRLRTWALSGALAALSLAPGVALGRGEKPAPRAPSSRDAHGPAGERSSRVQSKDVESSHASSTKRAAPPGPEEPHHEKLLPSHGHEHLESAPSNGKHAAKKAKPPPRPERKVRPLPPNATWKKYRHAPWKRGYVTLAGHGKKWSGFLVDRYGDPIPAARAEVAAALASWRTGKTTPIDDRLLRLIADVSDEFGGRPIRVVSGYREHSYAPDSRHKTGEAFDFSVPDVPNEAVRDFLLSLGDVGVGYYPNSTHVHLDVRDKHTYWVDYSRPGDRPMYAWDKRLRGMTSGERMLASALDALATRKAADAGPATVLPRVTEAMPTPKAAPPRAAVEAPHAAKSEPVGETDPAEDEREDDSGDDSPGTASDASPKVALDAGR